MYLKDKKYISALAQGLKIKDLTLLNALMGPEELRQLLETNSADAFVGDYPYINLHTHSNQSDGQLSPVQWLKNAQLWRQDNNLKQFVIALTDHDSIDGLIPVLKELIKNPTDYQGLRIVLGCELSTAFFDDTTRQPMDFEMLHYGINPFDKAYGQMLKTQSKNRHEKLPQIFKNLKTQFPKIQASLSALQKSTFYGVNFQKGLGCNWLYQLYGYLRQNNPQIQPEALFDFLMSQGKTEKLWQFIPDLMQKIKAHNYGFTSIAHPYRLQLKQRISDDFKWFHPQDTANAFIDQFFQKLTQFGVQGAELFYGNLNSFLQPAFDKLSRGEQPTNETEGWMNIIQVQSQKHFSLRTGGCDSHTDFLGTATAQKTHQSWQKLMQCWQSVGPLVKKGYQILDKEVTMGLPGPCMPPESAKNDIGIGSPYGEGAERIWNFFGPITHKILLGPAGKTTSATRHSPYVSELRPNPFFIPVEKLAQQGLISRQTLKKYYSIQKNPVKIDFAQVENAYDDILHEAYRKTKFKGSFDAFVDQQAQRFATQNQHPYIADLQVQIPHDIVEKNPDAFLPNFTLGTPPNVLSSQARNWGFPVFNPEKIWTKDGKLAKAGRLWQSVLRQTIQGAKGGLRIDHFIGFINPYVISKDPNIPYGRLYSSYDHPILKKYAWKNQKDFGKIIQDIVMPVMKECGLSLKDLYPEDIGSRPEQMDEVMKRFGLGRLLVAEFKEPNDPNHLYQLMKAQPEDIAALDTHDTPSIQMFFDGLDDAHRFAFAQNLAHSLRFHYNDSLKSTEQLTRMQWGELMASPAERVQGFFTSWTGQEGRYNQPGNPEKWMLRCVPDFEKLYFKNLHCGRAFNPLDAIALAIYARGDDFYDKHKDFVAQLRQKEEELKGCIQQWLPYQNNPIPQKVCSKRPCSRLKQTKMR